MRTSTKTWRVLIAAGTVIGMASGLVGCSGGSEEQGRVRAKAAQVVGVYQQKLDKGSERLELKTDGTYVQDTVSESRPFHHTGQWHLENHFLDGSEVVLLNAAITEPMTPQDQEPKLGFGSLPMYVHSRAGKVALARNEVADWYYERLD